MSTSTSENTTPIGRAGSLVAGKYRLQERIGFGGQGEVWRASEEADGTAWREVALKLLRIDEGLASDTGRGHAWLREVEAVRNISCDSLPVLYTVGFDDAQPYIAMELLGGESLSEYLKRSRMHWRKALHIAKAIAAALDVCHAKGAVHCDLKPANVFLERTGKRRVLVLDFGAATLHGEMQRIDDLATGVKPSGVSSMTTDVSLADESAHLAPDALALALANPIIGTPGFISPERLERQPPDAQSDAFSLGVLLYCMMTGEMPQRVELQLPAGAADEAKKKAYKIALNNATVSGSFLPLDKSIPPAVRDLVTRLLGRRDARPLRGELSATLEKVWRRPYGPSNKPFAGLTALGVERAIYLVGRKGDVDVIAERLERQRGILLCGPSGMGKSSLAMSGVATRLDEEMLDDTEGWICCAVRPSERAAGLRCVEEKVRPQSGPRLGTLVVVDQLEELLGLSAEERRQFCAAFRVLVEANGVVAVGDRLVDARTDILRVVATVRGDLFDAVARLSEFGGHEFLVNILYLARGVNPNELGTMVTLPLADVGYEIERSDDVDIIRDVVQAVQADAASLPLVQFALARLWEGRDESQKVLPVQVWRDIGGIEGALGDAAEKLYHTLSERERKAMMEICLSLFNDDGTRRLVLVAAVESSGGEVIRQFVEIGLVRRGLNTKGEAVLEVVHEALGRGWARLAQWLSERRVSQALTRAAEEAARQWMQQGQSLDLVWRGALLEGNRAALEAIHDEPTKSFVAASVKESRRQRRRSLLIERVLPATLLLVVALASSIGWIQTKQAQEETETERARLSRVNTELQEVTQNALATSKELGDVNKKLIGETERAKVAEVAAIEKEKEAVEAKKGLEASIAKNKQCHKALQGTVTNFLGGKP